MNKRFLLFVLIILYGVAAFTQIAKCKGKYLGNVIGTAVPNTYAGLWNQVTPENGTKWGVVEKNKGVYDWTEADVSYNWAKANGALFKFHALVWGSQMPDWVSSSTTAELKISIENYIKAAANHFNPMGGLEMIDVLNEPANPVLPDYMKAALTAGYKAEPTNANDLNNPYGWAIWPYQLARKYFPNSVLLTNEYNIEQNWQSMRAPYITIIKAIKAAPNITDGKKNLIDGVGLQCHGIQDLTATNFKACIDEIWKATGLPIHITEFDQWADPNETKQKTVYSTLIPVAWEHPHVAGITLWGYIQGTTWLNGNGVAGPSGTDSGIQYAPSYKSNPSGDRPALTWLKKYMASKTSLACCPAPAPLGTCYPPTVSITNPQNGHLLPSTAPIMLNASATTPNGTIASVSFYRGATLIGTVNTSPYSYSWTNATAGTYSITAVATDNYGAKTTSSAISIKIAAPVNYVYQCNACQSILWETTSNWTPATAMTAIDTAIIRTGEVKLVYSIPNITKIEANGIFRISSSLSVPEIRLQAGILKSGTNSVVLSSTIVAEKASTILTSSVGTSTFGIDGTVTGNANLTKTGVGPLQINAGASNFKGIWIINQGKLILNNATALGQCGAVVDSSTNLDVKVASSTNSLVVKKYGFVTLNANLTVQAAVFDGINIPAGTYTASNYPTFLGGTGTLTVAKSIAITNAPDAGSITVTSDAGDAYSWTDGTNSLALTSTFTPTSTGAYLVKATSSAGCMVTSAPIYFQTIALQKGWNLISTNIHPSDSNIATLFKNIDVEEIKTMDAFWRKGQNSILNSLQKITSGNGYLVHMNIAASIAITGRVTPFSKVTPVTSNGWQLIGCPYQTATPFSNDFNQTNCSIIKNFDGFWIPNGTINSIQNIEPGKGYYIKNKQ